MPQTTTASVLVEAERAEETTRGRLDAQLELAADMEIAPRHPKLPQQVERLRGQKVCSYCKHTIEEDPFFEYEGYWRRVLQNKTYVLRYGALELSQWAAGIFYFSPKLKARLLRVKDRLLLPGWVRCANPDCGQLYHASCWYQIAKAKGCLRCKAHLARRVE
jgi:hypothetical protein